MLTNPQGVALDGENTVGDTSTGAQLPLPSGNGYPGGNFFDSFIINTTPPAVLAGSFEMDPASDTNIVGDNITTTDLPTFDGTISEPNAESGAVGRPDRRSSTSASRLDNGVETYFSPTACRATCRTSPSSSARTRARRPPPPAGHSGDSGSGRRQYRAGDRHQRPARPCTGTYNVGADGILSPLPGDDQRLLRRAGADHRPERQRSRTPPTPMPRCRSSSTTRPPKVTVTSPTAGPGHHHAVIERRAQLHDHDQPEHRPDALQRRVDRPHQRRARRHSGQGGRRDRSRSIPTRSR